MPRPQKNSEKKGDEKNGSGFSFLVRDVSRLIRKELEKKSGDMGLTQAQWTIITHLAHHEGIKQATLAELMNVEPITLVGLLDKLEHAGWVERRPDPGDRRARRLHLTRQAYPLASRIETIRERLRQQAFAGVSPRDQQQTMHILQQIKENLTHADNR